MNIQDLYLDCTCVGISEFKFEELMEDAKPYSGSKIRELIKQFLPDLYNSLSLNLYNPFEKNCYITKSHLIYCHSAIEYFLRYEK